MAPIPPSSADQDDVCPHASRFTAPSLRRSGKEGTFRLDSRGLRSVGAAESRNP